LKFCAASPSPDSAQRAMPHASAHQSQKTKRQSQFRRQHRKCPVTTPLGLVEDAELTGSETNNNSLSRYPSDTLLLPGNPRLPGTKPAVGYTRGESHGGSGHAEQRGSPSPCVR
jgi:hypothetical protein